MNASFEEKSIWIQFVSLLVVLGGYFFVAGNMLAQGITLTIPYIPLFAIAVVLMVVLLTAGHIVLAITSRQDVRDERDRLIGWRSESNASWILGAGVVMGMMGLLINIEPIWIAHCLLLSLFLSELVKYGLQIYYYRRGF